MRGWRNDWLAKAPRTRGDAVWALVHIKEWQRVHNAEKTYEPQLVRQ
jgi:hypothetical protein